MPYGLSGSTLCCFEKLSLLKLSHPPFYWLWQQSGHQGHHLEIVENLFLAFVSLHWDWLSKLSSCHHVMETELLHVLHEKTHFHTENALGRGGLKFSNDDFDLIYHGMQMVAQAIRNAQCLFLLSLVWFSSFLFFCFQALSFMCCIGYMLFYGSYYWGVVNINAKKCLLLCPDFSLALNWHAK